MNRYTVKNNNGSLILAYSETLFNSGDNVKVTHSTRFDGIQDFIGTITCKTENIGLINGMLPPLFENNQPAKIGTISITRI